MDGIETAVAKNTDDFTGFRRLAELMDNGIGAGQVKRRLAGALQIRDESLRIEALFLTELFEACNLSDRDTIGKGERSGEFLLENVATGGI